MRSLLVVSLVLAAACDCGGSTMRARPEIEVLPASIDFGSVPVTTSLTKKVTIFSRGAVGLTLEDVRVQGDESFVAVRPLSTLLSPSTSTDVEVTFRPSSFGPKAARLIITSNAVNAPEVLVPLVGDSLGSSGGGAAGGGAAGGGAAGGSGGGSVAGGSTGGGCAAPSDVAFCAAAQKDCGVFTGVDGCGVTRTANCGVCTSPASCGATNVCSCAESTTAFCTRLGKNCGAVTANDACGVSRTADCGVCTAPSVCGATGTPNVCGCSDPDSAVCARLQKNCGTFTATDACGVSRSVTCGTCMTPDTCGGNGTPNVCGCGESNAAFCTRLGKDCGLVTANDVCGASRTVNCGTCAAPSSCGTTTPNVCSCAESTTELCTRLQKNCGMLNVTDRCGMARSVNCGTCAVGVSCGTDNVCACAPETDASFCARVGGCGAVTANDNCGASRTTTCSTTCGSCASPRPFPALGNQVSGTTRGTSSVSASCGGGGAPEEVWTWTPTASGSVTISTCGSSYDTVLSVRTGSCTGAEVACNDNTTVWCSNGSTNHSYVTFNAVAGTTYFIVIDGGGSASGNYLLRMSPPDGTCSAPMDFPGAGGLIKSGVNGNSTNSGTCGGSGADKVHRWVAPRSGTATATMVPDFWPSTLYVRSGTCTGAQLGCDNQTGQWPTNTVSFAVTAGTTYWIWAGLGTYNGPVVSIYDLTLTPPP